jgi:hypothetical protein
MAIIRSKIARQLLAEGGAPRKPFANGGFDYESAAAFGSDVDDFGMDFVDSDESAGGGNVNFTPQGPSIIDRIGDSIENRRDQSIRNFTNRNMMSTRDAILSLNPFGPKTDMNLFDVYQQMNTQGGLFAEGLTGTNLNMNRAKETFDKLEAGGIDTTKDIGPQLDNLTQSQISNIFNMNKPTPVSDGAPMLPRLPRIAKVPSDVEQQKSDLGEFIASIRGANPTAFNIPERFRLAEGGEPRQEYGLGSLVKKVTGAVKKVVKSDLGKAALAGAAIYGLGGGKLFGGSGFEFGKLPFVGGMDFSKIPGGGVTAGIVGTSLLGGLLASKEPEQDINALSQRISDQTGIDVSKIRGEVQQAYQNKDTSSLAQKYPFLVDQEYSASFSGGGDVKEVEKEKPMSPEEYFKGKQKFNKKKMLEDMENEYKEYLDRQKYGPRNEAANGGVMMASAVGDESDDISMQLFGKPVKDLNPDEFRELQDEIDRLMNKFRSQKPREGIMMASNIENERILENLFEKYLDMGLSPKDAEKAAFDEFERMSRKQSMDRTMAAEGGMMNLGGNEMDLRGGGFVPIGAREKADDVPARLSKNEFVFTADAVRAAGGGSVDRGADLMYKTMKQLENKVV